MEEEKKQTTTSDENGEQKKVSINWAEEASQELSDYIEEQGIQIRY